MTCNAGSIRGLSSDGIKCQNMKKTPSPHFAGDKEKGKMDGEVAFGKEVEFRQYLSRNSSRGMAGSSSKIGIPAEISG